jgi:predicted ATPase
MIFVFVESLSVERDLIDPAKWPFTVPCVAALARDGLRLRRPVTLLVGENGSGKSTLVEAIAEAAGIDARGGRSGRKYDNSRGKTPLGEVLRLGLTREGAKIRLGARNRRKGFFLRAETLFGLNEAITTSCLRLVALLHELGRSGAQVICATHSPVLAATPGADVVEVGTFGLRHAEWADLDLVDHWRRYLNSPDSYLRRIIDTA